MGINMGKPFVITGSEAILEDNASSGPNSVADSLTSIYTTRGSINLNTSLLPTINDLSVRPTDPIVAYDAFVICASGNVPTGVGGTTALNVGDLLVLTANTPETAAAWIGVKNTAIPVMSGNPFYGAVSGYIRVIDSKSPFFTSWILAVISISYLVSIFGKIFLNI